MVNVLDKDKILWYVMRAYKNENTAEDRLSNETYGLEYFIPKQKVLRTVKGKKVFFKEIYIETERIIIRNFKQKDAEGLLEYLSHPRVNCFAGPPVKIIPFGFLALMSSRLVVYGITSAYTLHSLTRLAIN